MAGCYEQCLEPSGSNPKVRDSVRGIFSTEELFRFSRRTLLLKVSLVRLISYLVIWLWKCIIKRCHVYQEHVLYVILFVL